MKVFLSIICMSLAGLIYYQFKYYPEIDDSVEVKSSVNKSQVERVQNRRKSIQNYKEIIARPLFADDRRPPDRETGTVAESIDIGELENLVLLGVVISGDTRYAILGNNKENSTEQIKVGYRYKGWKVTEIEADSIQFEGKEAQYELYISPSEPAKSTKKTSARKDKKKSPVRSSIFRSLNKSGQSSSAIRKIDKPATQVPLDEEYVDELGDEGGYVFEEDLVEGFDGDLDDFYDDDLN